MSRDSNVHTVSIVSAFPTWRQGLTVDAWFEISNTTMSSTSGANPSPNPGGDPANKFNAWTSFALDTVDSSVYSVANGGHSDYAGNEVNRLKLSDNAPGWTLPRTSSTASSNVDWYADDRPSSVHSYFGEVFNPMDRRVYTIGGSRWGNGSWATRTASYNPLTSDYDARSTHADFPLDGGELGADLPSMCVDPATGHIYAFVDQRVFRYHFTNKTWAELSVGNAPYAYYTTIACDSTRSKILLLGGSDRQTQYLYDIASNTGQNVTITGTTSVRSTDSIAMCYVPTIDRYMVKLNSAGGLVVQIHPTTFAASTYTTTGGGSIPAAPSAGLAQKMFYVPALSGLVHCPTYTGNAWFLPLA